MKGKIAVVAGTLMDTEMGVSLLQKRRFSTVACPISRTPSEQNELQFLSQEELFQTVLKTINIAKKQAIDAVFIYCNSLSSAIDLEKLKEKIDLIVISPFDAYQKIAKQYSDIILLAANSIATQKIELFLKKVNINIEILSLGYLHLVNSIEKFQKKEEIIKASALVELFQFLNALPKNKNRVVLLGCTHFPYLKEELQKISRHLIVDPSDIMVSILEKLII